MPSFRTQKSSIRTIQRKTIRRPFCQSCLPTRIANDTHGEGATKPKKTIKVCFVSSWFPSQINPYRTPFVPAFIKRFKKAGFEVDIVTKNDKGEPILDGVSKELHDSIPVHRINWCFPLFQMFRLIFKLRPDIIHVHAPNFFSSFSIVVGKILRTPVLVTIHRVEVMPTKNPLLYLARRIALNLFDRIVVVSEAVKRLTEKCGAYRPKISVVWNSAEEENFRPRSKKKARGSLYLPLEKKIILSVGRLAPIKGISYLIRAMPSILQTQEAILVIIGDGPERSDLQHLVDVLNLQLYVLFLGQMNPKKLALYYNAADVFVSPSLIEGHPVVLLEAMASGLPVIATDVGGNKETVINEVNGFLVPSKNPQALAQAIDVVLGNEALRQRFSEKSLEIYHKNFSEKTQVTRYLFIYQEILKRFYSGTSALVSRDHKLSSS